LERFSSCREGKRSRGSKRKKGEIKGVKNGKFFKINAGKFFKVNKIINVHP